MKHIKVCPKCGSTDIGVPPAGMDLRLTFPDYCRKCNQKGMFPEVAIDKLEEFKKEIKKDDSK